MRSEHLNWTLNNGLQICMCSITLMAEKRIGHVNHHTATTLDSSGFHVSQES